MATDPSPESQMALDAIAFAAEAHATQVRKGTQVPYIVHPVSVMRMLMECATPQAPVPAAVAAAALLHDTVEDTPVCLVDIEEAFGVQVRTLVAGAQESNREAPWQERKQHTIDFLSDGIEQDPGLRGMALEVRAISCADKLDNILSIESDLARHGPSVWERFNAPKSRQSWYYRHLAETLSTKLASTPYAVLGDMFVDAVDRIFA